MLYGYLYLTISESYLLKFMSIYTLLHIFYTRVITPPLKLKEGETYDLDLVLKDNSNIITGYAFYIMLFNMIALPIGALSSVHYWVYIGLSTILMAALYFSDTSYVFRRNSGNPGSIAYLIFPICYFPALGISIVLYLFEIGTSK